MRYLVCNTKQGGVGWIVRDSNRSPICAGMEKILRKWSIQVLEAKAILEGMKATHNQFDDSLVIKIESDALQLVKCLNFEEDTLSETSIFTEAISAMASKMGKISFKHCPMSSNSIAHTLAREAALIQDAFFCSGQGPSSFRKDSYVFWSSNYP